MAGELSSICLGMNAILVSSCSRCYCLLTSQRLVVLPHERSEPRWKFLDVAKLRLLHVSLCQFLDTQDHQVVPLGIDVGREAEGAS